VDRLPRAPILAHDQAAGKCDDFSEIKVERKNDPIFARGLRENFLIASPPSNRRWQNPEKVPRRHRQV